MKMFLLLGLAMLTQNGALGGGNIFFSTNSKEKAPTTEKEEPLTNIVWPKIQTNEENSYAAQVDSSGSSEIELNRQNKVLFIRPSKDWHKLVDKNRDTSIQPTKRVLWGSVYYMCTRAMGCFPTGPDSEQGSPGDRRQQREYQSSGEFSNLHPRRDPSQGIPPQQVAMNGLDFGQPDQDPLINRPNSPDAGPDRARDAVQSRCNCFSYQKCRNCHCSLCDCSTMECSGAGYALCYCCCNTIFNLSDSA